VGRVGRPHGLKGEVVVDLVSDRTERLDVGAVLVGDGARRLTVLASRAHQGRFLVFFEGVADRAGAEALRGTTLRAAPLQDPGTLWVHELVGAEVRSVPGAVLGRVVAVEANPASDLLVLDNGGLVPLRFVVDHRPGVDVTVEIPDGLFD